MPKLIQKFSSASARTVLLLGFGGLWQCWKFLSSILQLRSLHSSPFLSMTGDIFLKQVPCPLPARLDLELWWPVFSERSIRGVGRWANCTETCTETKFQVFCSRALLTNPKPPHLLPFPPAFLPLVERELWREVQAVAWNLCLVLAYLVVTVKSALQSKIGEWH